MKINPVHHELYDLKGLESMESWFDEFHRSVDTDLEDMRPWLSKNGHFYARRYGMLYRNVDQPWPGACDLVLPLIDKTLTRIKTGYAGVIENPEVPTSMVAHDDLGLKNAVHAASAMNSILMGSSPRYSMPDFYEQVNFASDDMLQSGSGVLYGFYSQRSEVGLREIRKVDLPPILRKLTFGPKLTEQQRLMLQAEAQARGMDMNGNDILARFGEAVNPVNQEVFDRHAERFKDLVTAGMGFDQDERRDRDAVDDILRWLRDGMPDGVVAIHTRFIVEETPRLIQVPIENCIVPRGTKSFQNARRLSICQYHTTHDIQLMAHDRRWNDSAVDMVLDEAKRTRPYLTTSGQLEDMRAIRTLQNPQPNSDEEFVEVRTGFALMDISGRGIPERVVVEYEPSTKARLSFRRFGDTLRRWPLVDLRFENNEPDFFSVRGIPEMIDDLDRYLTAWHRAKHNNMIIQTTAGFFIGRQARQDPEALRWRPGAMIEVDDPREVVPIQMPQTSIIIEREEQFLMLWVEGYIGEISTDLLADQRLLEPRTATEVTIRENARMRVLSHRVRAFNRGLQRAYELTWALAQRNMPAQFYAQMPGAEPILLNKSQIQGLFSVMPKGAVEDMDPQFRQQKAAQRWQTLLQIHQIIPDDDLYEHRLATGAKMLLDELGVMESRALMPPRPEEEIAARVQQKQQLAAQLQQWQQEAEKAILNAGNDPSMASLLLQRMRQDMPHKELQNLVSQGKQASAEASQAQDEAGAFAEMLNGR